MLIVPASKVSVPLDVVMRMRSSEPDSAIAPFKNVQTVVLKNEEPLITQVLDPIRQSVKRPYKPYAAAPSITGHPVDAATAPDAGVVERFCPAPTYPDVDTDPDPV